jgi:hypothetical protein
MKHFMPILSNSTEDVIWSQRILGRCKIVFYKGYFLPVLIYMGEIDAEQMSENIFKAMQQ